MRLMIGGRIRGCVVVRKCSTTTTKTTSARISQETGSNRSSHWSSWAGSSERKNLLLITKFFW